VRNKKSVQGSTVSKSNPTASAGEDNPPTLYGLFGPPPLLEGEDPSAYNELLARISARVKPADILEEIWGYEVVNHTWDFARWNRLKVELIKASTDRGVTAVLERTESNFEKVWSLSKEWAAGRPDAIKKVKEQLASANLSMDSVMALTLAAKITEIERIDRLATNAEMRRNAALREIERYRAGFAKALRSATDEVVDAEFEPVEAPQIENKEAA
jgi:hypothetical protein